MQQGVSAAFPRKGHQILWLHPANDDSNDYDMDDRTLAGCASSLNAVV